MTVFCPAAAPLASPARLPTKSRPGETTSEPQISKYSSGWRTVETYWNDQAGKAKHKQVTMAECGRNTAR